MKKRRVRFGIKWVDGEFIELLSMRPHGDGWVMWAPGSERHIMTIREVNAISSHITNQKTNEPPTPLGRLFFEDVNLDDDFVKLAKLRKLEESEYDQTLLYLNREFLDILLTYEFDLVTEEREKDILRYFDLSKMFADIQERIEVLRTKEIMPFLTCKASDLLDRKDIEAGISEKEFAVFEYEGELWEFDVKHMYRFDSEDHPWAEILRPLGVFELLREIDWDERLKET